MDIQSLIESCQGFQWDKGNSLKNWLKHGVTQAESEEVFLNKPILLFEEVKHSVHEERVIAFGQTNSGRKLVVAFTIRQNMIRIISARKINIKERFAYEKT